MRRALLSSLVVVALASVAAARTTHRLNGRVTLASDHPIALSAARTAARFGIISSTVRSVEHNRAVGGVPNSYHLLGQAIDVVRRPGVTHAQLAAALRAAGYRLIESLDEGNHSHFAFAVMGKGAAIPPPTERVLRNLLAADQHGTLLVDLVRASPAVPSSSASGRERVRSVR